VQPRATPGPAAATRRRAAQDLPSQPTGSSSAAANRQEPVTTLLGIARALFSRPLDGARAEHQGELAGRLELPTGLRPSPTDYGHRHHLNESVLHRATVRRARPAGRVSPARCATRSQRTCSRMTRHLERPGVVVAPERDPTTTYTRHPERESTAIRNWAGRYLRPVTTSGRWQRIRVGSGPAPATAILVREDRSNQKGSALRWNRLRECAWVGVLPRSTYPVTRLYWSAIAQQRAVRRVP
jgi:hypothetical protein